MAYVITMGYTPKTVRLWIDALPGKLIHPYSDGILVQMAKGGQNE